MRPLLVLPLLASLTASAQRFRSNVDAVHVDVLVTEGRRPVTGLTAADFELRDRGVLQVVNSVSVTDVPIDMIIALDTSGSVAGATLDQLKAGVSAALTTLGPKDRGALVTFSSEIRVLQSWTSDAKVLEAAVKDLTATGGTSLLDAVFTGLSLHEPTPEVRRLLLVFSDGDDTSSWLPRHAIVDKARRSDAVVYAVELKSDSRPPFGVLNYRSGIFLSKSAVETGMEGPFLEEVADTTGGTVYSTTRTGELRNAFKQIVTEFRTRYVLTYQPQNVDVSGWHPIEVKLKSRSGTVRARRGYTR